MVLLNGVITKETLLLLSRKFPVSNPDGRLSWLCRVSCAACTVCPHVMLHIVRAAILREQYCCQLVAQFFIVISYRSDMFRSQLSAIFWELATLSPCVADLSTDVAEILPSQLVMESASVNNKPQTLLWILKGKYLTRIFRKTYQILCTLLSGSAWMWTSSRISSYLIRMRGVVGCQINCHTV